MFNIRTHYLDVDDPDAADRLYATHPELGKSPDEYCPTCDKKGTYRWKGQDYLCDCEEQLQLHKHYLAAGIGMTYQRLSFDDLENNDVLRQVIDYAENKEFLKRGMGLFLTGTLGTGKTMAANLCLKGFIKEGFSCFATTFAEMVDLYTAGWYSVEDRKYFHRKVVESQVLLLDDVGRELKRKNRLEETTFDNVLRTRVQQGRSTIVTTNLAPSDLESGYGGAVLRLLREKAKTIEIKGEDFSEKANERELKEIDSKERRPIV